MQFSVYSIKQFLKLCGKERIIETFSNQAKNIKFDGLRYEPEFLKFAEQSGTDVVQLSSKSAVAVKSTLKRNVTGESAGLSKVTSKQMSAVRPQFAEQVKQATTPEALEKLIKNAENINEIEYLRGFIKQVAGKNAFGCKKTVELLKQMDAKTIIFSPLRYEYLSKVAFIKQAKCVSTPDEFEKLIKGAASTSEIEYLQGIIKQVAGKNAFGCKITAELEKLIETRAKFLKMPQAFDSIRMNFVEQIRYATTPKKFEDLINNATSPAEIEYLQGCIKQIAGENAFGHNKTNELVKLMEDKFKIFNMTLSEKEGYITEGLEVLELTEGLPLSMQKKISALNKKFDYSNGDDFNQIISTLDILLKECKSGSVNVVGTKFAALVKRANTPERYEELINSAASPAEIEYLQGCIKQIAGEKAFGYKKTGELMQLMEKKSKIFNMESYDKEGYITECIEMLELSGNLPRRAQKKLSKLSEQFDNSDGSDFNQIIVKLEELIRTYKS